MIAGNGVPYPVNCGKWCSVPKFQMKYSEQVPDEQSLINCKPVLYQFLILESIFCFKWATDQKLTKVEATVIKQKEDLDKRQDSIRTFTEKCNELEAIGYGHEASAKSSQQQVNLLTVSEHLRDFEQLFQSNYRE